MSAQKLVGGCQCGQVRYSIIGEPTLSAICHCTMCRRAHSSSAVAWAMFPSAQVEFTATLPKQYKSSPDVERGFCDNCGTQISFTADFLPGLIDIAVGSLDDPEAISPQLHYWYSKHLSWTEFADELPRYPELPPFE